MGIATSHEESPKETKSIKSEEGPQDQSENTSKNKIISLLGLDDHEKYFDSTDSDISELNDEKHKKDKGEILYFNESNFLSDSSVTNKSNTHRRKSRDDSIPKQGDFVNLVDGKIDNEMKDKDLEIDSPHRNYNKSIKTDSAHPCNNDSCAARNKQPECIIRSNPCTKQTCSSYKHETTASLSDKKNSSGDIPYNRNACQAQQRCYNNCTPSSRLCDSTKPRSCLHPENCPRMSQKVHTLTVNTKHKTNQDPSSYPRLPTPPTVTRSAPQQRNVIQQTSKLKILATPIAKPAVQQISKTPVNIPKRMQDTGTNTGSPKSTPCGYKSNSDSPSKSPSKSHPNVQHQIPVKTQTSSHSMRNSKGSTNQYSTYYTYDDQTTETTGYTNYETPDTTYTSDSQYDRLQDSKCRCHCVQCQQEFYVHHIAGGQQMQDFGADAASNFSDGSHNSDYMNLAYQKSGDYPVLVDELESTLSQRNRQRVQKTMQQFEMLSSQNKHLEKPMFEEEETESDLYDSNRYGDFCDCHKCQKEKERAQYHPEFEGTYSKPKMHKHVTDERNTSSFTGDHLKDFLTQNEAVSRRSSFKSTKFPRCTGYVEKVAKYMDPKQNHASKWNTLPKVTNKLDAKQCGWKMNPRTGDWEKVDTSSTDNYDFEENYPPLPPPPPPTQIQPTSESTDESNKLERKQICTCPSCQHRRRSPL